MAINHLVYFFHSILVASRQQKGDNERLYKTKCHTVINYHSNPKIGTDRPLQTVQTQIECHRILRLIQEVYTICHTYSNIVDTSAGL